MQIRWNQRVPASCDEPFVMTIVHRLRHARKKNSFSSPLPKRLPRHFPRLLLRHLLPRQTKTKHQESETAIAPIGTILTMTSEHLNRSDNETVPAHKTAFPSSWFAIVKGIWPGPLSSNDTAYSTKKTSQNDDESEAICTRLASLLQKRISSSELSPTNKEGYSNVPHCHQLESWDCGEH